MSLGPTCNCGKYITFCGMDCPNSYAFPACTTGCCPAIQSADYRVIKPMPKPTDADMDDPWFNAIWDAIKGRKLECPEYYEGWQIATGEHAKVITNMIKEVK